MTRRAVINGRFLSQAVTGVQRYAREATRALDALVGADAAVAARWRFEVVAPPDARDDLALHHIPVRRTRGRLRGHLWEQGALPGDVGDGDALVCFASTGPVRVRRQIVFVHDASVWAIPSTFSRAFRLWYRLLLPTLGRRVALVATVSEFSRRELVARAGFAARRLVVIAPGAEHALAAAPDPGALVRHGLGGRPFVLAVGSEVPHKQFAVVEAAMQRPECAGIELVVVGGASGRSHAAPPAARGAGRRLGRVSDGELRALYERAVCLAFPSTYEGFGLPPIEAMAGGCPVVVSTAGALAETCGDAALYCAPGDAEGLAGHVVALATDARLRDEMIERGRRRAAGFSWARTAREVVRALDGLDVPAVGDPPAARVA